MDNMVLRIYVRYTDVNYNKSRVQSYPNTHRRNKRKAGRGVPHRKTNLTIICTRASYYYTHRRNTQQCFRGSPSASYGCSTATGFRNVKYRMLGRSAMFTGYGVGQTCRGIPTSHAALLGTVIPELLGQENRFVNSGKFLRGTLTMCSAGRSERDLLER